MSPLPPQIICGPKLPADCPDSAFVAVPSSGCNIDETASSASSYGVVGCGATGTLPYCCDRSAALSIHYAVSTTCIPDTSGARVAGGCGFHPDFYRAACCPQRGGSSGGVPSLPRLNTPHVAIPRTPAVGGQPPGGQLPGGQSPPPPGG